MIWSIAEILNLTLQISLGGNVFKKNIIIKFNISLNKQFSQIANLEDYFKSIINNVYLLLQAKLNFDKNYTSQLFNQDRNVRHINIINALENVNDLTTLTENGSGINVISKKHMILENYKQLMSQTNHIIEYYNFINDANLFICSNDETE